MPGLLALLAHPDDEFFCAGLLAALSARDVPLHLVYWTRGEGGMSPRRRLLARCLPPVWHPRVVEARRVAKLLNAQSLNFLGSVDPVPDPQPRAPIEEDDPILAKLGRLLAKHQPEMLVTHGSDGDYGHPAHVRLHRLARTLGADHPGYSLISFNATWPDAPPLRFRNQRDPADFIFDSRLHDQKKIEIVRAHRSQRGVFEALAGGTLDDLLRATQREGYHCWSTGALRSETLQKLNQWVV